MIIKQASYEIQKSRFISYLLSINEVQSFKAILEQLKTEHKKATHFCYAYKIFDKVQLAKAFDDGEPHGAAGIPIYSLLERKSLNNVAIIVVRYFGGTKLGKGPLLRAYVKAASALLDDHSNCK